MLDRKTAVQWERLRDWLERPLWTAADAAYVIAGICPDASIGSAGMAWLPGGLRPQWKNSDPFALEEEVAGELQWIRGFTKGESRRPCEWISLALSKSYEPPWLHAALSSPECKGRLTELSQPNNPSPPAPKRGETLLRIEQVKSRVGLKNTAIYDRIKKKTFPKPHKIGRASMWPESEIDSWIQSQAQSSSERPI